MITRFDGMDDEAFLRVLDGKRNSPIIDEAYKRIDRLIEEKNPPADGLRRDCPVCEAELAVTIYATGFAGIDIVSVDK